MERLGQGRRSRRRARFAAVGRPGYGRKQAAGREHGTGRRIVGKITAAIDCRWTDPAAAAADATAVALGCRYALASGILEIRYRSGPDVILEGPAVYEVDSDRGGLLSRGRLTARVEPPWDRGDDLASLLQLDAGRQRSDGREQGSGVRGQTGSHEPRPQSPASTFVLRTPTATIAAGVGAEFGLEVEPVQVAREHVFQGDSSFNREPTATSFNREPTATVQVAAAHVFHGNVTLRPAGVENEAGSGILVGAGQLARVGMAGRLPAVSLLRGGAAPESFARRVFINAAPKPAAADQLATARWLKGIGADAGRPAGSRGRRRNLPSPSGRGARGEGQLRWPAAGERTKGPGLPAGVTYTYRTTFEVAGVLPMTAVVRVRFLAKGCVSGFRFNGQSVSGPVFDDRKLRDAGYFIARRDRVRSLNTVEIDVTGRTPTSNEENVMLLGITITGIRPAGVGDRGKEIRGKELIRCSEGSEREMIDGPEPGVGFGNTELHTFSKDLRAMLRFCTIALVIPSLLLLGAGPAQADGLLANWTLNDAGTVGNTIGNGHAIADSSGNGFNGTVVSGGDTLQSMAGVIGNGTVFQRRQTRRATRTSACPPTSGASAWAA